MRIHQILINDSKKIPPNLPKFHNICVEQIKKIYPEFEYHLYSGEEIEDIIKNNFSSDVFTAYKKLKPYACKADLSRLCLLYLYGGLYIDLNIYFLNPIPKLDLCYFFAFRDYSKLSKQSWSVQNGIMYSVPKSTVTKRAIDIIVNNCKEEYYGVQCVDVSATTVLGKAIMDSLPNDGIVIGGELNYFNTSCFAESMKNELGEIGYDKDSKAIMGFIMDEDDKLISLRKPTFGGDIKSMGFKGSNNYVEMWDEKDIYDSSYKFTNKSIFNYQ